MVAYEYTEHNTLKTYVLTVIQCRLYVLALWCRDKNHGLLDTVDTTVLVELAVVGIDCANAVTLLGVGIGAYTHVQVAYEPTCCPHTRTWACLGVGNLCLQDDLCLWECVPDPRRLLYDVLQCLQQSWFIYGYCWNEESGNRFIVKCHDAALSSPE